MMAQNISITDFRIPTSKYQRFLGGLSGMWGKRNVDSYYQNHTNPSSNSNQSTWFSSSLDYELGNFSEDHSLEIYLRLNGQAGYDKSGSNWTYQNDTGSSARVQKNYGLDINPTIRYSNYFTSDTWYWYVEGLGYYTFDQFKSNNDQIRSDTTSHDLSYNKNNNWNASLGGGVGYGKLRDGSTIFAILRILDKLKEDSLLTRPLLKEEILKLVDILARRNEYAQLQDRYVKFLMGDLFNELQKMGVLKNNVPTAYSVERAVEVISEQIEPRLFGWRVRVGVQRLFYEDVYANENSSSPGYITSYGWSHQDNFKLVFDYGYPFSLNFQVNSNFSMNILGIDYKRKIGFNFSLKGIYQIGERIDASISESILRNQALNSSSEDQNNFVRNIQYNTTISFRFFIENRVSFVINCIYSDIQSDSYSSAYQSSTVTKGPSINFGLNYRFI